jgi:LacI family transcriptional regulator
VSAKSGEEKRVSISDVAARAGVSISTVSRVINDTGYPVSAAVRARVLAAVEELHYSPDLAAQGLRKRFNDIVGLIVRDISDNYFGEIAKGVSERAMELGLLSFVCNTGRNPANELEYHELLWRHRVRGIILSGGGIDTPEYRTILERQLARSRQYGLALVALNPQGMPVTSVTVDYARVASMMVAYLAERGHRSIALISGRATVVTTHEHIRGFRAELAARNIPLEEGAIETRDFTEEGGYEGCRALLGRGRPCTALCAGSDSIAVGAVHALHEAKIAIPEQISIISVGDVPQARFVRPPLTTVAIPRYRMGVLAVDMIAGRAPMETAILEPSIVERSSVAERNP